MGKKGRKGNDDWEKDFELDEDGELKALKEPAADEAAPPGLESSELRPINAVLGPVACIDRILTNCAVWRSHYLHAETRCH